MRRCLLLVGLVAFGLPAVVAAPASAGLIVNDPIVVSTTDDIRDPDDGLISLREAFDLANGQEGQDEIVLAADATYQSTLCDGDPDDDNTGGDFDHNPILRTDNLTITGNDATIENTCENERVVHHLADGDLWLVGVTIRGGDIDPADTRWSGSGLLAEGPAVLDAVAIVENKTTRGSSAQFHEDGRLAQAVVADNVGTGVEFTSLMTSVAYEWVVADSLVARNEGMTTGGVAATDPWSLNPPGSTLAVIRSAITDNSTTYQGAGGGLGASYQIETLVSESEIVRNESNFLAAGLHMAGRIERSLIADNVLRDPEGYGGIGGGVFGDVEIVDSTISGNRIEGLGYGAGIVGNPAVMRNVTVVDNVSGPLNDPPVAVLAARGSDLDHVTIADNPGGAPYAGGTEVAVRRSVFDSPAGAPSCLDFEVPNVSEHNVANDEECAAVLATEPTADLAIQPLRDNGGGLPTALPETDSPAVDAITVDECSEAVAHDQRGVARPYGAGCDIGAVERSASDPGSPLHVSTTADTRDPDDGLLSLREAFDLANSQEGPNEIVLANSATYRSTLCDGDPEDDNDGGDFDHYPANSTDGLVLTGNEATIENTCPGERVLHHQGGDVSVADVTLTGGDAVGWGGASDGAGAALIVPAGGRIVVERSNFVGNHAEGAGGGLQAGAAQGAADGEIRESRFEQNTAEWGGGYSGTVDVEDSTFRNNRAKIAGGGVSIYRATGSGLLVEGNALTDPVAGVGDLGGGGAFLQVARLDASVIRDNWIEGASDLDWSGGTAGGGVYAIDSEVAASLIANNHAGDFPGGGVHLQTTGPESGETILVNSTVTDNRAATFAAVSGYSNYWPVLFSTISGNTADDRTSLEPWAAGSVLDVLDGQSVCADWGGMNLWSVEGDDSCEPPTAQPGQPWPTAEQAGTVQNSDTGLADLADNGGQTETMRPTSGSPAIDHIDPAHCIQFPEDIPPWCVDDILGDWVTDQRGVDRPRGAALDAGAVEVVPASPYPARHLLAVPGSRVGWPVLG